jgi:hypothetical protein
MKVVISEKRVVPPSLIKKESRQVSEDCSAELFLYCFEEV